MALLQLDAGGGGSTSSLPSVTQPPVAAQQGLGALPLSDADIAAINSQQVDTSASSGMPPPKVDIPTDYRDYVVVAGDQGFQGSCTAWAVGYAMATYLYCKGNKLKATDELNQCSPGDLYIKTINRNFFYSCGKGTDIRDALNVLKKTGCDSMKAMPYISFFDSYACSLPSSKDTFKIKEYESLSQTKSEQIKFALASGIILPFATRINTDKFKLKDEIYNSLDTPNDLDGSNNHAMVLVGYDDAKKAWRALNSWGTNYRDNGYLWIDYATFERDAYLVCKPLANEYVTNYPPQITLLSDTGDKIDIGKIYTIIVSITDADSNLSYVDINWNDNSPVERHLISPPTGNQIVQFFKAFQQARMINWSVTAYDLNGRASNMIQKSFDVINPASINIAPSLQLNLNSGASIYKGDLYKINLTAQDSNGDLTTIDLNWNDGSAVEHIPAAGTSSTVEFAKAFQTLGLVQWSATAYDATNLSSNMIRGQFNVLEKPVTKSAPTLIISSTSGDSVNTNNNYTVILYAKDIDGNLSYVELSWNDGSPIERIPVSGFESYATFSKTFTIPQTITWSAMSYDSGGLASPSVQKSVVVSSAVVAPALTGFAPSQLNATDSPQELQLFGSNLVAPVTLNWRNGGSAGSIATTLISSTEIRASIITGTNSAGYWNISLACNGLSSNEGLLSVVAVSASPPVITSISPTSLVAQDAFQTITIYGSNFTSTSKVNWIFGTVNGTISSANTAILSSSEIRVTLRTMAAGYGTWYFTINTAEAGNSNQFVIQAIAISQAPSLNGFNRSSITAQNGGQYLTLYGNGFTSDIAVKWKNGSYSGTLSAVNTKFISTNEIQIFFNTTLSGTGYWYFSVTNSLGTSNWLSIIAY